MRNIAGFSYRIKKNFKQYKSVNKRTINPESYINACAENSALVLTIDKVVNSTLVFAYVAWIKDLIYKMFFSVFSAAVI